MAELLRAAMVCCSCIFLLSILDGRKVCLSGVKLHLSPNCKNGRLIGYLGCLRNLHRSLRCRAGESTDHIHHTLPICKDVIITFPQKPKFNTSSKLGLNRDALADTKSMCSITNLRMDNPPHDHS